MFSNEMHDFFSKTENANRVSVGEGIVVRDNKLTDFVFCGNGQVKELGHKFDDGELSEISPEMNKLTYKFAFKIDGREVASMVWDGYYPKFVRDKIDLSNKRGKYEIEDLSRLSFEQYLLYKMVKGKSDLIYGIISHICTACSYTDNKNYTTNTDEIMEAWNDSRKKESWRII